MNFRPQRLFCLWDSLLAKNKGWCHALLRRSLHSGTEPTSLVSSVGIKWFFTTFAPLSQSKLVYIYYNIFNLESHTGGSLKSFEIQRPLIIINLALLHCPNVPIVLKLTCKIFPQSGFSPREERMYCISCYTVVPCHESGWELMVSNIAPDHQAIHFIKKDLLFPASEVLTLNSCIPVAVVKAKIKAKPRGV